MTNQDEHSPKAAAEALLRNARRTKRVSSIEATRPSTTFIKIWAFGAVPFLIVFGLGLIDSRNEAAGVFLWVIAVILIILGIALGAIIRLLAEIADAVNDPKSND